MTRHSARAQMQRLPVGMRPPWMLVASTWPAFGEPMTCFRGAPASAGGKAVSSQDTWLVQAALATLASQSHAWAAADPNPCILKEYATWGCLAGAGRAGHVGEPVHGEPVHVHGRARDPKPCILTENAN